MARPRLIQNEREVLRRYERGHTLEQIQAWHEVTYQIRVSVSAINSAISRAGAPRRTPRHDEDILPWRGITARQSNTRLISALRAIGRRRRGQPLTAKADRAADALLRELDAGGLIVDYRPEGGPFLTKRLPSDHGRLARLPEGHEDTAEQDVGRIPNVPTHRTDSAEQAA